MTETVFGPNDVPTVFFISKSDDRNRVDYGLRLNDDCLPVGDQPLFPYWRELENAPPERTHPLKFIEHFAYGVAQQRLLRRTPAGAEIEVKLKPLDRAITITAERGADGRCRAVARTIIGGVANIELVSAYVQLLRPMSVEYVEIHGRHPMTGQPVEERLVP